MDSIPPRIDSSIASSKRRGFHLWRKAEGALGVIKQNILHCWSFGKPAGLHLSPDDIQIARGGGGGRGAHRPLRPICPLRKKLQVCLPAAAIGLGCNLVSWPRHRPSQALSIHQGELQALLLLLLLLLL